MTDSLTTGKFNLPHLQLHLHFFCGKSGPTAHFYVLWQFSFCTVNRTDTQHSRILLCKPWKLYQSVTLC